MISFKGAQFPRNVILFAVFFYVRYTVSYRDLEEIMAERGVHVDRSWRMDETYIKVKGEWVYLYRAVDKLGKTLDFMPSKRRNKTAPTKSFLSASATLHGSEVANMIRKGQLTPGLCPFAQFAALAS